MLDQGSHQLFVVVVSFLNSTMTLLTIFQYVEDVNLLFRRHDSIAVRFLYLEKINASDDMDLFNFRQKYRVTPKLLVRLFGRNTLKSVPTAF